MTETAKKKARVYLHRSPFFLLLLAIVAVVAVIVSRCRPVARLPTARLSDFCTAPVKGFAPDALPVCLFVMILGGFLGILAGASALDNSICRSWCKLKGQ